MWRMGKLLLGASKPMIWVTPRVFASGGGGKKALVMMAHGMNEMELVIAVSLMRKAQMDVVVSGVPQCEPMTLEAGLTVSPDEGICESVNGGPYEAAIIPGGKESVKVLGHTAQVCSLLKNQEKSGKIVATIGHGPLVLKEHGLFHGSCLTSTPAIKDDLSDYKWKDEKVVRDGALITAQGPGAAFNWIFAILECVVGTEKTSKLKKEMGLC